MSDAAIIPITSRSCRTLADGTLRITVDVEPMHSTAAFQLFGQPDQPGALARITQSVAAYELQKAALAPFGEQAKILRLSSFFRTPDVWRAVVSDEEYLAWVRLQPSAYSGKFSEYLCGIGKCEAAHVRRVANGSGTSIKPPYSAIPLTGEEHTLQSVKGESALNPQDWWDKKRIDYLQKWCWETLKAALGYEHWSEIHPDKLRQWASSNGRDVEKYLPHDYRCDA